MPKFLLLILTLALLSGVALAQSQSTTGNIEGRVLDQNGAVVPGVALTATNQDTGFTKNATSDSDGNFIFVLLPPGNYKVEVRPAHPRWPGRRGERLRRNYAQQR